MGNPYLAVIRRDKEDFEATMKLLFGKYKKLEYFLVEETINLDAKEYPGAMFQPNQPRLILFWTNPHNPAATKLPYKLDCAAATEFAWGWVTSGVIRKENFGFGDTDIVPAWAIFTEAWGHAGGTYSGICSIMPQWGFIGK